MRPVPRTHCWCRCSRQSSNKQSYSNSLIHCHTNLCNVAPFHYICAHSVPPIFIIAFHLSSKALLMLWSLCRHDFSSCLMVFKEHCHIQTSCQVSESCCYRLHFNTCHTQTAITATLTRESTGRLTREAFHDSEIQWTR